MAKKRLATPETTTSETSATWFANNDRKSKIVRRRQRFPMSYSRTAESNVPFSDPTLHRTWAGKAPIVSTDVWDEMIIPPKSMSEPPNLWRNPAVIYNIPEGYIATSSGIEPLTDPPGTQGEQQGYQLDYPGDVDSNWVNDTPSGYERYEQKFTSPDGKTQFYKTEYIPVNSGTTGRIIWQEIKYFPPVEPEVRYPNSIFRRRKY